MSVAPEYTNRAMESSVGMFNTARAVVISSFPDRISGYEKPRLLRRRFYGRLAKKTYPDGSDS